MSQVTPGPDEDDDPSHSEDLKRKVFAGAVWTVGARWGVRGLGLISTVILARLLEPKDFGLVAMASVITGIIMAFTQMEMDAGLIRLRKTTNEHFNTAWTISALMGLAAAGVLVLIAPLAAQYYHEPRVQGILYWIALTPLISGLANPKIALFRKGFQFGKDFRLQIFSKLMGLCISIPLAFWLRDYRALVYSMVGTGLMRLALGYFMQPYLPSFSLAKRVELLSFSFWLMLRNVGNAASGRVEQIVLGANFGAQRTSYYFMAREIGPMLSYELALPMGRALLPGLAAAQHDEERMKRGVLLALTGMTLVIPMSFGLASLAPEVTVVFLGDKWLPAANLLAVLCLGSMISGMGAAFGPILMVRGHIRALALSGIVGAVIMYFTAEYLSVYDSLMLIALVRVGINFLSFSYLAFLALHQWPDVVRKLIYVIARPLAVSAIMFAAVKLGQDHFDLSPFLAVVVWPIFGALLFGGGLLGLWTLVGKPYGIEQYIMQALSRVRPMLLRRLHLQN